MLNRKILSFPVHTKRSLLVHFITRIGWALPCCGWILYGDGFCVCVWVVLHHVPVLLHEEYFLWVSEEGSVESVGALVNRPVPDLTIQFGIARATATAPPGPGFLS